MLGHKVYFLINQGKTFWTYLIWFGRTYWYWKNHFWIVCELFACSVFTSIYNSNIPTCWMALDPGTSWPATMSRTCLSSWARAFSLSFSLPSVPRSLTSSSCSRLCCLWSRASSPMADPAALSPVLASRDKERHNRPAVGVVGPSCQRQSSKMESCLMTAP